MEKDEKGGKFKSIATAIGLEALTAFSGNRAGAPEPPQPVEAVLQYDDSEVVTSAEGKFITEEEKQKAALEQAREEENDIADAFEHSRLKELERRKEEWEEENNGENPLEDSPGTGNNRSLADLIPKDTPESTEDMGEVDDDTEDFLDDIEWEDPEETDELVNEFEEVELEDLEMEITEALEDEPEDFDTDTKSEFEPEADDGDWVHNEITELEDYNADQVDTADFDYNPETVESDDEENIGH
ncbi:hypothetical protein ACS5NO_28130 [Larkinella sp. GY13]|uniref:hypothetical protein n=1 Tax=Larkinella sp. GY13 TaxID=3453720 RepID=UPI003EEA56B2